MLSNNGYGVDMPSYGVVESIDENSVPTTTVTTFIHGWTIGAENRAKKTNPIKCNGRSMRCSCDESKKVYYAIKELDSDLAEKFLKRENLILNFLELCKTWVGDRELSTHYLDDFLECLEEEIYGKEVSFHLRVIDLNTIWIYFRGLPMTITADKWERQIIERIP